MEIQQAGAAVTTEKSPLYEYLKCTASMTNNTNANLTFQNASLKYGKWSTQPWSNIPAGASNVTFFEAEGRDAQPHGTEGTVNYQFPSIYGGQITMAISFNVPAVGNNTATVGLSGNASGSQGTYDVSYTYDNSGSNANLVIVLSLSTSAA